MKAIKLGKIDPKTAYLRHQIDPETYWGIRQSYISSQQKHLPSQKVLGKKNQIARVKGSRSRAMISVKAKDERIPYELERKYGKLYLSQEDNLYEVMMLIKLRYDRKKVRTIIDWLFEHYENKIGLVRYWILKYQGADEVNQVLPERPFTVE